MSSREAVPQQPQALSRNPTRAVRIGGLTIGAGHPIAVQSMAATRTRDRRATLEQVHLLERAGADIVRIAADTAQDVAALAEIRQQTHVALSVDLQENYRLVSQVAPHVEKVRYNPGHLHHHEPQRSIPDKVAYIVEAAATHDCALRVGVNCGSVDPAQRSLFPADDLIGPMLASALEHCRILDDLGFVRYCVSLKDSDPQLVVEANQRFARERPDVPLHLGVTEAGMPPEGVYKTRAALAKLIPEGIGDTIRVSLTVSFADKGEEIRAGRQILAELASGGGDTTSGSHQQGLNIISCPSCSRVENEAFVDLAHRVRQVTQYARDQRLTIAVMGCRVNGPGETDNADLGLWCAPKYVNLKRGTRLLGRFGYEEVLHRLKQEVDAIIAGR